MTAWRVHEGGIVILVRAVPRSSREGLAKGRDGCFAARVNAAPVDAAANAAIVALVARSFDVARCDVAILSGETGRDKRVRVVGDPATLAERAARLYGAVA